MRQINPFTGEIESETGQPLPDVKAKVREYLERHSLRQAPNDRDYPAKIAIECKAIEPSLPDDWTVKAKVREYFETHDRGYGAKIAKATNLRWSEVSNALKELVDEGFLVSSSGHYRKISGVEKQ